MQRVTAFFIDVQQPIGCYLHEFHEEVYGIEQTREDVVVSAVKAFMDAQHEGLAAAIQAGATRIYKTLEESKTSKEKNSLADAHAVAFLYNHLVDKCPGLPRVPK